MLKEKELKKQNTFFKYKKNIWYDNNWNYQLKFIGSKNGICELSSHDESNGNTEFIGNINNLSDLINKYNLLTNYKFIF